MDGGDTKVTLEISDIERQQPRDTVDQHGGGQASVVNLHSSHGVSDDEATPLGMGSLVVGQEAKRLLEQGGSRIRLRRRQAEPVARSRTSADVPELDQILRREAQAVVLSRKDRHCPANQDVVGIAGLGEPQKDVGIEQDRHYCGLSRDPGKCSRG